MPFFALLPLYALGYSLPQPYLLAGHPPDILLRGPSGIATPVPGRNETAKEITGSDTERVRRPVRTFVRAHGLLLAFLGGSLYFLASITRGEGYDLFREDGLFESLTSLFCLAGSLLCLVGFRAARGHPSPLARYATLGWVALFLIFAMEEISWGQRILGVEAPEFFADNNLQNETNLHNFSSHNANRLFYVSAFAAGVALPALRLLNRRFDALVTGRGLPLPPPDLIVPFAISFAFVAPGWTATAPEMGFLVAAMLLGFAVVLWSRWPGRKRRLPELSTVSIWTGLLGVALVQLVLALFEENLGHRSHPSEIKEFLFSACLLAFAWRVRGTLGPRPAGPN